MIFSVEGNIGAGKTTLLKKLANLSQESFKLPHIVAFEPVDDWMNLRTSDTLPSLFELYYADKKRYGYVFQMYALLSRIKYIDELQKQHPGKIIICERCPLTDCDIFATMMHDHGILSDLEMKVYRSWYDHVISAFDKEMKGVIYLSADPKVCVQRVMERNRKGEDNIDGKYLKELHNYHEKMLGVSFTKPICRIDGNVGINQVDMSAIIEFINSIIDLL